MNRFGLSGCLGDGRSTLIGLGMLCVTVLLLSGKVTLPEIFGSLKSLELRQVALSLASNCAHTQEDMITTAKRFMDFLQQGT